MSFRLRSKFTGLFHDEVATDSFWIREQGQLSLPSLEGVSQLTVVGEVLPPAAADRTAAGSVGLAVAFDGRTVASSSGLPVGPFRIDVPVPAAPSSAGHTLTLRLLGVGGTNLLAWLGRLTGLGFLHAWRHQARNRRLRIQRVEAGDEVLYDFGNRSAPWNAALARRFLRLGLNIVGFYRADLGVGESVRCMARAAEAARLDAALVNLKLHTINPQTDNS